jgi:hypothetical protein
MENKQVVQWQPIIELSIVLFTILGSTIPLYLHTDSKIDAIHQTVNAIQKEMSDFHARLCVIEDRNRKG